MNRLSTLRHLSRHFSTTLDVAHFVRKLKTSSQGGVVAMHDTLV